MTSNEIITITVAVIGAVISAVGVMVAIGGPVIGYVLKGLNEKMQLLFKDNMQLLVNIREELSAQELRQREELRQEIDRTEKELEARRQDVHKLYDRLLQNTHDDYKRHIDFLERQFEMNSKTWDKIVDLDEKKSDKGE